MSTYINYPLEVLKKEIKRLEDTLLEVREGTPTHTRLTNKISDINVTITSLIIRK